MIFDVAVIGGGVCGCAIARELSKFKLDTVLLEAGSDIASGASKANTGIIHAGYDPHPGTLKAKFNAEGLRLIYGLCEELGVEHERTGSLVVGFSDEDDRVLNELLGFGEQNGISGIRIVRGKELFGLEPGLCRSASSALFAKDAGIVCPYGLVFALAELAAQNGVRFLREFDVSRIQWLEGAGLFELSGARDSQSIRAGIVINASGTGCERIARMIGAWDRDGESLVPRLGEYMVLDKSFAGPSHVLFPTPSEAGKGITVSPTVSGNTLVGPTSRIIVDGSDTSTTREGLDEVFRGGQDLYPTVKSQDVISLFAGVRSTLLPCNDFVIEESARVSGFINVAGIQSPGLTSAPAIARHVVHEIVGKRLDLETNESFSKKPVKNKIANYYSNSRIVCRCEHVSEAHVLQSIRGPVGARTLSGVKLRTRAGMGRCQGGFCSPLVARILSRELGISLDKVRLDGIGSEMLSGGRTK